MVTKSSSYYKKQVREMWDKIFSQDSEKFRDFYFRNKYSHHNTLIYVEDEKVVSSLQNLDYNLLFNNKSYAVSYISGACTFEEYRGKGYAGLLIKEALREDYKNNKVFSSLIPASKELFDFYKRFGYVTSGYMKKHSFNADKNGYSDFEIIKDFETFYHLYNKNIQNKSFYLNKKNLEDYFEFLNIEKGKIICKGKKLAIVLPFEDKYFVEFSLLDDEILIKNLEKDFIIPKFQFDSPFSMMRITNVKIFLDMIFENIIEKVPVKITDSIIFENNCILIKENNEIFFKEDIKTDVFEISVEKLLSAFLNGEKIIGFNFYERNNIKMFMMMN
ncbi:MAG: GNAT family N-acetyltransferase [Clostridia bacterium]|nr:GNAT family N-acetyltransferase [Clostridia bacterium]